MRPTVPATDRKPEATIGKDWVSQREMPLLAAVGDAHEADADFISRASWDGTLRYAVQRSGYDDYEVADAMPMSHGYMSRVMRGAANLSGERLIKFMRITGSVAPLQWLADQMGYELLKKTPAEDEVSRLKRELEEERRKNRRA